ncbi:MAG: glycoside hydrolase/phage tail family protein [Rhizobiaceae bacterium]
MATILLQAAGGFLGGLFGPIGATIGTAAGALAGYVADRALLQSTRHIHGPRLSGPRPLNAEEGAPVPRLYGTARLGATVIWATRFEEVRQTKRQGFKGGPKVTTYSYFANAAFALCEGEIAGIRRVWADGNEIDREQVELRIHTGTEAQPVDPLVEAKQGSGNTPAYRGIAYAVIERFALADYGNRIPQFQFEVIRPVGNFNDRIRAVVLIPGATEFGLSPTPVSRISSLLGGFSDLAPAPLAGSAVSVNRSVLFAPSDLAASLDELQMLCPNVEHVALLTAWFGDDLRAGQCRIRPMVTDAAAPAASGPWTVSGETPASAAEVSRHDGGAAFGGTPADQSVVAAIGELKARGYKVTLYPFVMMDIPAGSGLPDPYGDAEQPAYPWRGRITCDPAQGRPGTADKTAAARAQVDTFCGGAVPAEFQQRADTVDFSGAAGEWGYRRMLLHYANLAAVAGGVDAFLIGSELRGLTTLRDEANAFPFVEALVQLAGEVSTVLGPETLLTYGADWSEYFGHQPDDGSGDVFFHLDALWAASAIGAVGIDNYLPLTDWRDADYGGGHPDGTIGPYDREAMRAAVAGGERHDWYYASRSDRDGRIRTPITDGAYGKPWVFRPKDLAGWWRNQHYDRIGGVEAATPTAWVPQSKPIWFTELGCAAVDKGPNQPNVFLDPKSSESAKPYFSDGGRNDLAPRRFLEAHYRHWDENEPGFSETHNPLSAVYGERMVDLTRIYAWAWDARPFPAFPLKTGLWADGENWLTGHWLTGRLSQAALGDVIDAILADHGLPPADTTHVDGVLAGYVTDDAGSARAALEPLIDLFGLAAHRQDGALRFFAENLPPEPADEPGDLVADGDEDIMRSTRLPDHELASELVLHFRDPMQEYRAVSARRLADPGLGGDRRQHAIAFPGTMEPGQAEALAAGWLRRQWAGRDSAGFQLPASARRFAPGSVLRLPHCAGEGEFIITGIDDGLTRAIEARRIRRLPPFPDRAALPPGDGAIAADTMPLALFLDLPITGPGIEPQSQLRVAAWGEPWRTQVVSVSPEESGFADRTTIAQPAVVGLLETTLPAAPSGREDRANTVAIRLIDGEFESVTRLRMLNGANALAVRSTGGAWEILQFETAEEVAASSWRLTGLLRGQLGTEDAAAAGSPVGAFAALLDDAVVPAGLLGSEIGLQLNWRVAPSGLLLSEATAAGWSGVGGVRALTPLSPVHLSGARLPGGDYGFSWVRRGRVDADSWLGPDIPLGEASELYAVRVLRTDGTLVREAAPTSPEWVYAAADIAADFPAPSEFDLAVSQVSVAVGPGIVAMERFSTV